MAVAIALSSSLPARAINLHNGLFMVHNNTTLRMIVTVAHLWTPGNIIDEVDIAPGGVWYSSKCCFAAGSEYLVKARYYTPSGWITTELRAPAGLCQRGVPYGFASLQVKSGGDKRDPSYPILGWFWIGTNCYEAPL